MAPAVDIDGSPYLSRDHTGIRFDGLGFTLQDLNSLVSDTCRSLSP